MASIGGDHKISAASDQEKVRNDKLKLTRERQHEERLRKIEELKLQAEAAQKYREQKEEERRRRLEEMRQRDVEKRQQVEERKRAILEAEMERREYILKKNQERESRLGNKRQDRNSISFAFGSSTPRLLEPSEFGMVSSSTFWGQRRSTSTSNVAGISISRRSSERDLADNGNKVRATSVAGTGHYDDELISQTVLRSVARRKTDLLPTIPIPRDGHYSSKSSLNNTPRSTGRAYSLNRLDQLAQPIRRNGEHISAILERERRQQKDLLSETESLGGDGRSKKRKNDSNNGYMSMSRSMTHLVGSNSTSTPRYKYSLGGGISSNYRPFNSGSRSGNVTPGGNLNTSRPDSAMSTSTTTSTPVAASKRKPRPASIAGTNVSVQEINKFMKDSRPPVKTTSKPSISHRRIPNMMSMSMIVTGSARSPNTDKKTPNKRESMGLKSTPISKAASIDRLHNHGKEKSKDKSGTPEATFASPTMSVKTNKNIVETEKLTTTIKSKNEKNVLNSFKTYDSDADQEVRVSDSFTMLNENLSETSMQYDEKTDQGSEKNIMEVKKDNSSVDNKVPTIQKKENGDMHDNSQSNQVDNEVMTASLIAKSKITTEEEAKAALAERRRLAREEAERNAELERQRIEAERLCELKRQEEEAERQRQFEEEAIRLAEEQRKAEEERLRQAIEEAKQREEENRRKREEEERQRIDREEAEKKAKEEAEKQRLEVAERLKREEKEREERRKRVEAIMSRTRKGGSSGTSNSTPTKNTENEKSSNHLPNTTRGPTSADGSSNAEQTSVSPASNSTETGTAATNIAAQNELLREQDSRMREIALIQNFSNMIIDENVRNLQHEQQQQQQQQQEIEVTNYKNHEGVSTDGVLQNVANGNGHMQTEDNKNDIHILQDMVAPNNTLIDLSIESQDLNHGVNFNNNHSLLTATTALVTANIPENKDLSLL